jgi:hypothetical protein
MYKTVGAYMGQNNSVWSGMPRMVTAVQQLDDNVAAIDVAAQKQETATMGASQDKAAARATLEDVLFLMCEALGVLGHTVSDNNLSALADLSPSRLHQMGAEELANRATNVLAQATARAQDLAASNVTPANINELSQRLEDFNTAKEQPRTAMAHKTVHTGSLASLLSDTSGLLRNEMDRLVNLFRRTNPEFVAGYRAARVIVDRPASHKTKKKSEPPPPDETEK